MLVRHCSLECASQRVVIWIGTVMMCAATPGANAVADEPATGTEATGAEATGTEATGAEGAGASGPGAVDRGREVEVDLSPLFAQRGLTIRDQGARGTCSVFTVTRALEFALTDGKPREDRLSVEYLNWAANRATGKYQDGSFFSDLWTGYERFGICDEKQMPYASDFEPGRRPSREAREQARSYATLG